MALNDLLKQEKVENEGAWLPVPGGGEIHVAFAGNPDFAKKQRRLERIHRKKNSIRDNKEIADDDREEIFRDAMIGTIVKAIRGIKERDSDKEPLESTDENIRKVLESRKIRATVLRYVTDEETFTAENLELVAKN